MHHFHRLEVEISVDAFGSFARLAGALSLQELFKIGRGSSWHRAQQHSDAISTTDKVSPRGSAPPTGPASEPKRNRLALHAIVAGAWIVTSLLLLAYATIEGEFALADLDGLDLLATYAWSPP